MLGFANGQWVELSDDGLELNGLPGQLLQIDTVDEARRVIVLKTAPAPLSAAAAGVDPARSPKLRRWDQRGDKASADGVKIENGFLPLEDGIEVQFALKHFNSGDYWLIPARTATGEIEWPPFATPNTNPYAQPPHGIRHHVCRLALLRLVDGKIEVQDCRKLFPPLTELPTGEAATALHVVGTNWQNDDLFAVATLLKDGRRIKLDAPPDAATPSIDSVIFTIDMPTENDQFGAVNALDNFVLIGNVAVDENDPITIVWRLVPRNQAPMRDGPAMSSLFARVAGNRVSAAVPQRNVCRIYLDGQLFGTPVARPADDVRMSLSFPSGDGARAADFESWFYLGGQEPQRTHAAVIAVAGRSPQFAGFSGSRPANVLNAFSLAIDRATLLGLLPENYRVQDAPFDLEQAKAALHQADVGGLFVAGMAAPANAGAVHFIRESLGQIGIESNLAPVDELQTQVATRMAAGDFFDVVLCAEALTPVLGEAGMEVRTTLLL